MRKFITVLLVVCLMVCTAGCNTKSTDIQKPVNFYYLRTKIEYSNPDSMIVSTVAESKGYENNYEHLIRKYLEGPSETKLKSPFPESTKLLELNCENNRVEITLSAQMAEIEGITLMLALACLTKTTAELTGIQTVQIQIAEHQINGKESITLSPNNFSYWDTVTANSIS